MPRRNALAWKAVALVAALTAALGGAAIASHGSSSDDTITGCYGNSNGQLRITDSDDDGCKRNETKLTWSKSGSPGKPGPDLVASGLVGPDGEVGFTTGSPATVTHVAPGQYEITIELGNGCPVPTLTGYGHSVVLFWGGGGCGGGTTTTYVHTEDGTDRWWSYHFLGEQTSGLAAQASWKSFPGAQR